MEGLCELARLSDLGRLYDVKRALEARGIEARISSDWIGGKRFARGTAPSRLMVRRRDLVYARWVACAAGLDAWPDEPGEGEASAAQACPYVSEKAVQGGVGP